MALKVFYKLASNDTLAPIERAFGALRDSLLVCRNKLAFVPLKFSH